MSSLFNHSSVSSFVPINDVRSTPRNLEDKAKTPCNSYSDVSSMSRVSKCNEFLGASSSSIDELTDVDMQANADHQGISYETLKNEVSDGHTYSYETLKNEVSDGHTFHEKFINAYPHLLKSVAEKDLIEDRDVMHSHGFDDTKNEDMHVPPLGAVGGLIAPFHEESNPNMNVVPGYFQNLPFHHEKEYDSNDFHNPHNKDLKTNSVRMPDLKVDTSEQKIGLSNSKSLPIKSYSSMIDSLVLSAYSKNSESINQDFLPNACDVSQFYPSKQIDEQIMTSDLISSHSDQNRELAPNFSFQIDKQSASNSQPDDLRYSRKNSDELFSLLSSGEFVNKSNDAILSDFISRDSKDRNMIDRSILNFGKQVNIAETNGTYPSYTVSNFTKESSKTSHIDNKYNAQNHMNCDPSPSLYTNPQPDLYSEYDRLSTYSYAGFPPNNSCISNPEHNFGSTVSGFYSRQVHKSLDNIFSNNLNTFDVSSSSVHNSKFNSEEKLLPHFYDCLDIPLANNEEDIPNGNVSTDDNPINLTARSSFDHGGINFVPSLSEKNSSVAPSLFSSSKSPVLHNFGEDTKMYSSYEKSNSIESEPLNNELVSKAKRYPMMNPPIDSLGQQPGIRKTNLPPTSEVPKKRTRKVVSKKFPCDCCSKEFKTQESLAAHKVSF